MCELVKHQVYRQTSKTSLVCGKVTFVGGLVIKQLSQINDFPIHFNPKPNVN
jgi:hypothetical protein